MLIESDVTTQKLISLELVEKSHGHFNVECVSCLSQALTRIADHGIAAILLRLSLPDIEFMEAFDNLVTIACGVPIVILSETSDEAVAVRAVGRGAQDYLLRDHWDGYSLRRAIHNSIERKAIEDTLFIERERALVTLNSIGDAVLSTDIGGRVSYLNKVAEGLTGWSREEAIGTPFSEVFHIVDGATREIARDPMRRAVEEDRTVGLTANCILIRKDGVEFAIEDSAAPIHDRARAIIGAVIVFHDVSEARAISRRVAHMAEHDAVTGLPNRLLLHDRLTQAISLAHHHKRPLAVLFLDLDHFKHINDSLGHSVGDDLLRSVAKRLVDGVRGSDTVSRQGGDEFVVLLAEVAHSGDAAISAEKLLLAINAPHRLEGHDLSISSSIGISIYPDDGLDAETLIKNADIAMYHAKQSGRNTFQFFESEMTLRMVQRQLIESNLRRAIENSEFLLHYQPIVSLSTGQIAGVEALLRWQHPDQGLVYPDQFVPIAEECGLIVQIGRWVLGEACRQARMWADAGLPHLAMSVNVSAVEFSDKKFIQGVHKALSESCVEAARLKLELTEGVLMKDVESTASVLRELTQIGVQLAVDDFGTGYSSLSYLRQFPISVLKIDRSFVQQISDNSADSAIVSAIIGMGKSLGHVVVAEGIETERQKHYLQTSNCPLGQGYLFSRPVPPTEIADLLQAGKRF